MPITFRQIEAFRAVMVTGTVTQAAEMLHVSQPAVSRMLADLEYELGFKLFERTSRQLIPSDEGRALYHEVQRAFVGLKEILEAARAIREYRAGQLRLITIPSVAASFMPQLLAKFARRYPEVSIALEVQPSPRVFEWIVSLQCDLGISSLPTDNSLIEVSPFMTGESVCILPRKHRLAAKKVIRCRDLAGENFISFNSDSLYRFRIDEVFRAASVDRIMKIEARTVEAVFSIVATGLGVSIIPPFFPLRSLKEDVIARSFRPTINLNLAILRPTHKPISRTAEKFLEITHEFAAEYQEPPKGRLSKAQRGAGYADGAFAE